MEVSTDVLVHILTYPQNPPFRSLLDLSKTEKSRDAGIWYGRCIEDQSLTFVVLAGFPENLEIHSHIDTALQQHLHFHASHSALIQCLGSPVTEIASATFKPDVSLTEARPIIDAAMQTVLQADGCVDAVWNTNALGASFVVGWEFLQAHEEYHKKVHANPPDCITALPKFIASHVAQHVSLEPV